MTTGLDHTNAFEKPRRQSPVAILLFIIKAMSSIIRQAWPVLLLLWFNRSGEKWDKAFLYTSIGVTLISAVYSIINYFKTYFYLSDSDLRHQTGLLGIEKTTIPFDKVQAIHNEQNLIHKLFHVTRLIIDTAGSGDKEFKIDALSVADADAIKKIILEKKKSILHAHQVSDADALTSTGKADPSTHTILKLGLEDLLKAGLFHNHLQSLGWVFAIAFGLYQIVSDLGVKTDGYFKKIQVFDWQFLSVSLVLISIGLLMLTISISRILIRFYGFILKRIDRGFMIRRGLMKEFTFTASDNKIQAISWSDDPIKRIIKIFDFYFLQAKSMDLKSNELIRVPGARAMHIDQITEALYPDVHFDDEEYHKMDKRYMSRHGTIILLLASVAVIPAVIYEAQFTILFITAVSMYWMILTYLGYKKFAYKHSPDYIFIKEGYLGNKYTLAPIDHIQSIRINQSPYQRKNQLATLHLHFSSHQQSIPFIRLDKAYEMANTLLYHIEAPAD